MAESGETEDAGADILVRDGPGEGKLSLGVTKVLGNFTESS